MKTANWSRTVAPALATVLAVAVTAEAAPSYGRRVVPADTVVRVRLDDSLSSRSARVSQTFEATLDRDDRSGLPEGTRFIGTVTEARRGEKNRAGVLGVKFRTMVLPDGRRTAINGTLGSLRDEDVRRSSDGRISATGSGDKGKFDLKWVGYGAAGGAVLSTILGGDLLDGALIGAVGGAAYSYLKKDKAKNGDVELKRGTEFGVLLRQSVAFNDSSNYRYGSSRRDRDDRYSQDRRDRRDGRVRYDDRTGRRYDDRYDSRYDDRYDSRYGDRYDDRYDRRYDERDDRRYDERDDRRYDERDDRRYEDEYDERYESDRRTAR